MQLTPREDSDSHRSVDGVFLAQNTQLVALFETLRDAVTIVVINNEGTCHIGQWNLEFVIFDETVVVDAIFQITQSSITSLCSICQEKFFMDSIEHQLKDQDSYLLSKQLLRSGISFNT